MSMVGWLVPGTVSGDHPRPLWAGQGRPRGPSRRTDLRQAPGRLGIVLGTGRPWAVRRRPGAVHGTVSLGEGQGWACPWRAGLGQAEDRHGTRRPSAIPSDHAWGRARDRQGTGSGQATVARLPHWCVARISKSRVINQLTNKSFWIHV
jgi:hypothetical protein